MINYQEILAEKRTALIAVAFIGLLLLYTIIHTASDFFLKREPVYKKPTNISLQIVRIPPIANWHLFGFYQDRAVPQTQLELTLEGILYIEKDQPSQVLISSSGSPAKVYVSGQEVTGGVKVYRILPKRVLLLHNGKLETLLMKRQKLKGEK